MPEKRDEKMICLALSGFEEGSAAYLKANRFSFLVSA